MFPSNWKGIIYLLRTQNFPKNITFLVKNISFSKNFAYVINKWSQTVSWKQMKIDWTVRKIENRDGIIGRDLLCAEC